MANRVGFGFSDNFFALLVDNLNLAADNAMVGMVI